MEFLGFQIPDSLFSEAVGVIPSLIVEESLEENLMSVAVSLSSEEINSMHGFLINACFMLLSESQETFSSCIQ